MRLFSKRLLRRLLAIAGWCFLGAVIGFAVAVVLYLNSLADLEPWHTVELAEELTARSDVTSLAEYLELEERLFHELARRLDAVADPGSSRRVSRFNRGSLADPGRWPRNWNRTFELVPPGTPRAGVLLLHGLSDSPYSLRHIGESLHAHGAQVLGLRLPGHGTAPSALLRTRWQDMAAAVRLAMVHLRKRIGAAPLFIIGYSTGGALAVQYVLGELDRSRTGEPSPIDGIVLISPAIGVTPAAALAVWQERVGRLLGLRKLEWNTVLPEYDPYKYQSFAINAGDLSHRLTLLIAEQITELAARDRLDRVPPILAFQSAVDSTVSTPAVIEGLMARLPNSGPHELIVFDVNRVAEVLHLLVSDPRSELSELLSGASPKPFTLSVITNANDRTLDVVVRRRRAGSSATDEEPLGLAWPPDVFSLSHVALPFPEADPLYGSGIGDPSPGVQIGGTLLRGENGTLQIPAEDRLRIRWNPFFAYVERRILAFTGLGD